MFTHVYSKKMRLTSKKARQTTGMSLVEILIGCTIITIGILALINTYSVYVKYALTHDKNVQASYLLAEGLEAVSLLRDQSWSANITPLSSGTTYYLAFNGTSWTLMAGMQYVDSIFLRTAVLEDVTRDASDKIISSSGTADANTKKVTITVAYPQSNGTTTQSISKYITNLYKN